MEGTNPLLRLISKYNVLPVWAGCIQLQGARLELAYSGVQSGSPLL